MENLKLGKPYKLTSFGCYRPIMSLNKDSFKEMQQFFLLKIVADNPEGVTAYQLHTNYSFPRSNAIRLLDELEENTFVSAEEQIKAGRTNKIYTLTQSGFKFLLELKTEWAERFMMMEELTTRNITSTEKKFFIKEIRALKTKEDRLNYLLSLKSKLEGKMAIAENKYTTLLKMKDQIELIKEKIKSTDDLDDGDLMRFFDLANQKEEK